MSHFSENLERIMHEEKLTNYRLSKIIDCSQTNIANWRQEKTHPRLATMGEIAQALGYDADSLDTDKPIKIAGNNQEHPKAQNKKTKIKKGGQNVTELKLKILLETMKTTAEGLADAPMSTQPEDLANLIGWANGMMQAAVDAIRIIETQEMKNAATDVGASITAG